MLRLLALALLVMAPVGTATKKPNFVMLFADDLGYGDVGFNGHPTVRTPNLDRAAWEGMRITNMYSAAPVCTPSRAGMMTGRLPIRSGTAGVYTPGAPPYDFERTNGVFDCNAEFGLPLNETTIAEVLKANGYRTGMAGKWHLGQRHQYLPNNRGFDEYYGIPYSDDMGANWWQGKYHGETACNPLPVFNNSGPGDYNIVEQPACFDTLASRYAQHATSFIQRAAEDDTPFFYYMAFSHVHTAIASDPQWAGPEFWNTSLRGPFGDAAAEFDWVAGQILTALTAAGIDDNTVVAFDSDNGPWRIKQLDGGSYSLFQGAYAWMNYGYTDTGKASTWEGGVREPAFVRWTGVIPPGSVDTSVRSTMDFFPTFLSLAGIPPPSGVFLDGQDMSNAILHGPASDHGHSYLPIYRNAALFAMRFGPYKAHWATKSGYGKDETVYHSPPLLFNVDVDPSEMYPIDITQNPQVWGQLNASLADHFKTLTVGANLLPFSNRSYGTCCDPAKSCNCTNPYADDPALAAAVRVQAEGVHAIGQPWWTHEPGNDW